MLSGGAHAKAKGMRGRLAPRLPSSLLTRPHTLPPSLSDYDDVAFEPVDASEMRDATLAAAADAAPAEVRQKGWEPTRGEAPTHACWLELWLSRGAGWWKGRRRDSFHHPSSLLSPQTATPDALTVDFLDSLTHPTLIRGAPGDEPAASAAALALPLPPAPAPPALPWWTPDGLAASLGPDTDLPGLRVLDPAGGDGPRWRPRQWGLYCAARSAAARPPRTPSAPRRAASGASVEDEADSTQVVRRQRSQQQLLQGGEGGAAAPPSLASPPAAHRGISAESRKRLLTAEVVLDGTPLGGVGPPAAVAAADAVPPSWPPSLGPSPRAGAALALYPAGGFTDWRPAPGGATGWLFGLAGRLSVVAAPPSTRNAATFAAWVTDTPLGARSGAALVRSLDGIVRADIRPGDALFVPAGWLSAVAAPALGPSAPDGAAALTGAALLASTAPALAAASSLEDDVGARPRHRWPAFEAVAWCMAERLARVLLSALPPATAAAIEAGVARGTATRRAAAEAAAAAAAREAEARAAAAAARALRAAAVAAARAADNDRPAVAVVAAPPGGAPVLRVRLPGTAPPPPQPTSPKLAVRLKLPLARPAGSGGDDTNSGAHADQPPTNGAAAEPASPPDTTPPPPRFPLPLPDLPPDARPSVLAAAPSLVTMLRSWASLPGVLAEAAPPGTEDPEAAADRLARALAAVGLPCAAPPPPPRPSPAPLEPLAPPRPPRAPSPLPALSGEEEEEAGDSADVDGGPSAARPRGRGKGTRPAGGGHRPAPPRSGGVVSGGGGGVNGARSAGGRPALSVKDRLKKKLKIK